MKLNIALLLLGSATAFAPQASFVRPSSSLLMQDTSEAVKNALEVSEKMGKTSVEARIAWELVEEMDAANAREKTTQKAIEKKQAEIQALMTKLDGMEECSTEEPAVVSDTSDAVKKALEMSRVFGKTSPEARMAWEEVEEMDAANAHAKKEAQAACEDGVVSVSKAAPVAPAEPAKPEAPPALATPGSVEEAINNALLLTKAFGKTSSESRLAWELVEEMEAQDSHKRSQLKAALQRETAQMEKEKAKEKEPEKEALHIDSETAIQAAMAASEKFGKTSVEARIAWELVEEIGATNAHHKSVGSG